MSLHASKAAGKPASREREKDSVCRAGERGRGGRARVTANGGRRRARRRSNCVALAEKEIAATSRDASSRWAVESAGEGDPAIASVYERAGLVAAGEPKGPARMQGGSAPIARTFPRPASSVGVDYDATGGGGVDLGSSEESVLAPSPAPESEPPPTVPVGSKLEPSTVPHVAPLASVWPALQDDIPNSQMAASSSAASVRSPSGCTDVFLAMSLTPQLRLSGKGGRSDFPPSPTSSSGRSAMSSAASSASSSVQLSTSPSDKWLSESPLSVGVTFLSDGDGVDSERAVVLTFDWADSGSEESTAAPSPPVAPSAPSVVQPSAWNLSEGEPCLGDLSGVSRLEPELARLDEQRSLEWVALSELRWLESTQTTVPSLTYSSARSTVTSSAPPSGRAFEGISGPSSSGSSTCTSVLRSAGRQLPSPTSEPLLPLSARISFVSGVGEQQGDVGVSFTLDWTDAGLGESTGVPSPPAGIQQDPEETLGARLECQLECQLCNGPGEQASHKSVHVPHHWQGVGDGVTLSGPVRVKKSNSRERLAQSLFLAYMFSKMRRLYPTWRSGLPLPWMYRPSVHPYCRCGQSLASEADFREQRARGEAYLGWMREHVSLLTKLQSGAAPIIMDLFCGAGGAAEGVRRMGAVPFGVDKVDQPEFKDRFGVNWFERADAIDRERLRHWRRQLRPLGWLSSPPCEGESTCTFGGEPSYELNLIPDTRDALRETGDMFTIENVRGARHSLRAQAVMMLGQTFGLHTERPRLFEAGGGLELSGGGSVAEHGLKLRRHTCLGAHAKYPRLDAFKRAWRVPCCEGNLWSVVGKGPVAGSTLADNAAAMGIDVGHMPYSKLRKALPPAYVSAVVGHMVMSHLKNHYGLPVVSYDEMIRSPFEHKRQLQFWRRGAGGTSPELGLQLMPNRPPAARAEVPVETSGENAVSELLSDLSVSGHLDDKMSLDAECMRELDYTYAGGFDQVKMRKGGVNHLGEVRHMEELAEVVKCKSLLGLNTLVLGERPGGLSGPVWAEVGKTPAHELRANTRITIVCSVADEAEWREVFEPSVLHTAMSWTGGGGAGRVSHSTRADDAELLALTFGYRTAVDKGCYVRHADFERYMDPRDLGVGCEPTERKAAISYTHMPSIGREAWGSLGFSERVKRHMLEGVSIEAADIAFGQLGPGEKEASAMPEDGQYAFADAEHFVRGCSECDRAILVGHLEPVPAHLVKDALRRAPPHPWTVVEQGGKWRACQDYSKWTNERVGGRPFTLPTVFDVQNVVGSGTHFAKYDLRDGFWSVPVKQESRHNLMVRHPATGELLWCRSLPFGYKLSPLIFCEITEAVGAEFRKRVAGLGIHCFVFVDDFLICGDTKELTEHGMRIFDELLKELGLPGAPHKKRGASRVMEFLGHLLVNTAELQCVALTAKRQMKLVARLDDWLTGAPGPDECIQVEPQPLAVLLGHLVFCSEVIPHGRTYMQSMLRSFAGLEVDWKHGVVRFVRESSWGLIHLPDGFWRDLVWWRSSLACANCVLMRPPSTSEAAITGSDASDWGSGGLVWLDGSREEVILRFLRAEKRRPINFRELRGGLRILEIWGHRLRGRTVLIELDNTSAISATRKERSKAEDMQELVRRIVELAEKYDIRLRPSHTPGVALIRPDATSRGAAVEESRFRFREEVFKGLEGRFGPFHELLGAEREFARIPEEGETGSKLWLHPTSNTIMSTLQLIFRRLDDDTKTVSGVVVLPCDPGAVWWRQVKYLVRVGGFPISSPHLEECKLGQWKNVSSRRPSVILHFPSTVGKHTMPLAVLLRCEVQLARAALQHPAGAIDLAKLAVSEKRPLPLRSVLYIPERTPASEPQLGGCLLLTMSSWNGTGRLLAAYLRRQSISSQGRSLNGQSLFVLEKGLYTAKGGSFFDAKDKPFEAWPCQCWLVNHLCDIVDRRGVARGDAFEMSIVKAETEVAVTRDRIACAGGEALLATSPSYGSVEGGASDDDWNSPSAALIASALLTPPSTPGVKMQAGVGRAGASHAEGLTMGPSGYLARFEEALNPLCPRDRPFSEEGCQFMQNEETSLQFALQEAGEKAEAYGEDSGPTELYGPDHVGEMRFEDRLRDGGSRLYHHTYPTLRSFSANSVLAVVRCAAGGCGETGPVKMCSTPGCLATFHVQCIGGRRQQWGLILCPTCRTRTATHGGRMTNFVWSSQYRFSVRVFLWEVSEPDTTRAGRDRLSRVISDCRVLNSHSHAGAILAAQVVEEKTRLEVVSGGDSPLKTPFTVSSSLTPARRPAESESSLSPTTPGGAYFPWDGGRAPDEEAAAEIRAYPVWLRHRIIACLIGSCGVCDARITCDAIGCTVTIHRVCGTMLDAAPDGARGVFLCPLCRASRVAGEDAGIVELVPAIRSAIGPCLWQLNKVKLCATCGKCNDEFRPLVLESGDLCVCNAPLKEEGSSHASVHTPGGHSLIDLSSSVECSECEEVAPDVGAASPLPKPSPGNHGVGVVQGLRLVGVPMRESTPLDFVRLELALGLALDAELVESRWEALASSTGVQLILEARPFKTLGTEAGIICEVRLQVVSLLCIMRLRGDQVWAGSFDIISPDADHGQTIAKHFVMDQIAEVRVEGSSHGFDIAPDFLPRELSADQSRWEVGDRFERDSSRIGSLWAEWEAHSGLSLSVTWNLEDVDQVQRVRCCFAVTCKGMKCQLRERGSVVWRDNLVVYAPDIYTVNLAAQRHLIEQVAGVCHNIWLPNGSSDYFDVDLPHVPRLREVQQHSLVRMLEGPAVRLADVGSRSAATVQTDTSVSGCGSRVAQADGTETSGKRSQGGNSVSFSDLHQDSVRETQDWESGPNEQGTDASSVSQDSLVKCLHDGFETYFCFGAGFKSAGGGGTNYVDSGDGGIALSVRRATVPGPLRPETNSRCPGRLEVCRECRVEEWTRHCTCGVPCDLRLSLAEQKSAAQVKEREARRAARDARAEAGSFPRLSTPRPTPAGLSSSAERAPERAADTSGVEEVPWNRSSPGAHAFTQKASGENRVLCHYCGVWHKNAGVTCDVYVRDMAAAQARSKVLEIREKAVGHVSTAMTTRQAQPTLVSASAPSADTVAEMGQWQEPGGHCAIPESFFREARDCARRSKRPFLGQDCDENFGPAHLYPRGAPAMESPFTPEGVGKCSHSGSTSWFCNCVEDCAGSAWSCLECGAVWWYASCTTKTGALDSQRDLFDESFAMPTPGWVFPLVTKLYALQCQLQPFHEMQQHEAPRSADAGVSPEGRSEDRKTGLLGGAAGDDWRSKFVGLDFRKRMSDKGIRVGTILDTHVHQRYAFIVEWHDGGRGERTDLFPRKRRERGDPLDAIFEWQLLGETPTPATDGNGVPIEGERCKKCQFPSTLSSCPVCQVGGNRRMTRSGKISSDIEQTSTVEESMPVSTGAARLGELLEKLKLNEMPYANKAAVTDWIDRCQKWRLGTKVAKNLDEAPIRDEAYAIMATLETEKGVAGLVDMLMGWLTGQGRRGKKPTAAQKRAPGFTLHLPSVALAAQEACSAPAYAGPTEVKPTSELRALVYDPSIPDPLEPDRHATSCGFDGDCRTSKDEDGFDGYDEDGQWCTEDDAPAGSALSESKPEMVRGADGRTAPKRRLAGDAVSTYCGGWRARNPSLVANELYPLDQDGMAEVNGTHMWVVAEIVNHRPSLRARSPAREYEVSWVDYPDTDWIQAEDFCEPDLVKHYDLCHGLPSWKVLSIVGDRASLSEPEPALEYNVMWDYDSDVGYESEWIKARAALKVCKLDMVNSYNESHDLPFCASRDDVPVRRGSADRSRVEQMEVEEAVRLSIAESVGTNDASMFKAGCVDRPPEARAFSARCEGFRAQMDCDHAYFPAHQPCVGCGEGLHECIHCGWAGCFKCGPIGEPGGSPWSPLCRFCGTHHEVDKECMAFLLYCARASTAAAQADFSPDEMAEFGRPELTAGAGVANKQRMTAPSAAMFDGQVWRYPSGNLAPGPLIESQTQMIVDSAKSLPPAGSDLPGVVMRTGYDEDVCTDAKEMIARTEVDEPAWWSVPHRLLRTRSGEPYTLSEACGRCGNWVGATACVQSPAVCSALLCAICVKGDFCGCDARGLPSGFVRLSQDDWNDKYHDQYAADLRAASRQVLAGLIPVDPGGDTSEYNSAGDGNVTVPEVVETIISGVPQVWGAEGNPSATCPEKGCRKTDDGFHVWVPVPCPAVSGNSTCQFRGSYCCWCKQWEIQAGHSGLDGQLACEEMVAPNWEELSKGGIGFYHSHLPYYEFTNFYAATFVMNGVEFEYAENAYQAEKHPDHPSLQENLRLASTPRAALDMSRRAMYRDHVQLGWHSGVKQKGMLRVIRAKFHPSSGLAKLLLDTGTLCLVELAPRDKCWGGLDGGENWLGICLMTIRAELRRAAEGWTDSNRRPVSGRCAGDNQRAAARAQRVAPEVSRLTNGVNELEIIPPRVKLSVTNQPLVESQSDAARCYGCNERFGRALVCQGGTGLIHNSLRCAALADKRLAEESLVSAEAEMEEGGESGAGDGQVIVRSFAEAAREAAIQEAMAEEVAAEELPDEAEAEAGSMPDVEAPTRDGSDQRRAQMRATLSSRRTQCIRLCLEGKCAEAFETPMKCRNCPATLHGVACGALTKGFAALGSFLCAACNVKAMFPNADPGMLGEAVWTRATNKMILEMSMGAEQTGAGLGEFKRLEMQFALSFGVLLGQIVLASDCPEVFKMFLEWLVISAERAKSLKTVFRAAGSAIGRTRAVNVTRDPSVKAFMLNLVNLHGEESSPRTAVTSRMVTIISGRLIESTCSKLIRTRVTLMYYLEIMFGIRVGECLAGGDFHGMLANNLVILTNLETGRISLEGLLEHSKTNFLRYINAVGTSEGECKIELAAALRAYWREAGFALRGKEGEGIVSNGYLVEGPNYYVLRVSLIAVSEPEFARLGRVLESSESKLVRRWATVSIQRGDERRKATGSTDKKYINVVGGVFESEDMATVTLELERAGFGDLLRQVPGPLMRGTHGVQLGYTNMPLSPQSTYDTLHKLFDEAYKLANEESPDPELDLQGLRTPLWGHHSLRRFADTNARKWMDVTGASERDIDLVFGWQEQFYSQKMQLHYETKFTRETRVNVTRMI